VLHGDGSITDVAYAFLRTSSCRRAWSNFTNANGTLAIAPSVIEFSPA
jgi:hypothetical protein